MLGARGQISHHVDPHCCDQGGLGQGPRPADIKSLVRAGAQATPAQGAHDAPLSIPALHRGTADDPSPKRKGGDSGSSPEDDINSSYTAAALLVGEGEDVQTLLLKAQDDLDLAEDMYRQCQEAVPLCIMNLYIFSPESGHSHHLPRTGAPDELCAMLARALGRDSDEQVWAHIIPRPVVVEAAGADGLSRVQSEGMPCDESQVFMLREARRCTWQCP